MAIIWLERARQKNSKTPNQTTAFTAHRFLNAVNAVPHPRDYEKSNRSRPSIRSNRSAPPAGFSRNADDFAKSQEWLGGPLSLLCIDDVWVAFEERAAILKFCEGLDRSEPKNWRWFSAANQRRLRISCEDAPRTKRAAND
ncbi:hypothetical protein MnTg02_01803 [bacterium MnTg02]|nr:hypothetical protein MnTg02_01803 [bacterium MnTg02]